MRVVCIATRQLAISYCHKIMFSKHSLESADKIHRSDFMMELHRDLKKSLVCKFLKLCLQSLWMIPKDYNKTDTALGTVRSLVASANIVCFWRLPCCLLTYIWPPLMFPNPCLWPVGGKRHHSCDGSDPQGYHCSHDNLFGGVQVDGYIHIWYIPGTSFVVRRFVWFVLLGIAPILRPSIFWDVWDIAWPWLMINL